MGLGASGTVVVLVALPEVGGAVGGAVVIAGAAGGVTVWQTGSDGESSHVDTD